MKKLLAEFKEFAIRGNVIDLAVAVIIGNAINAVVHSLVNDIFTPVLSLFIGRINIKEASKVIKSSLIGGKDITIGYGSFLQSVLDFLTITFCIFIMLKIINKLHSFSFKKSESEPQKEEPLPPPTTDELLIEIRDLLKEQALSKAQPALQSPSDLPDGLDKEH